MAENVKLWRYYLPEGPGEEWAEIVLTSTGMFSATSDWGNYAYAWRSFGECFRSFLAEDRPHFDYFVGCLGGSAEYDADATYAAAHALIAGCRETHGRAFVAEELRTLDQCSRLETAIWFGVWLAKTEMQEAHSAARFSHHPRVIRFCNRIMPRLAAVLRAELEAEGTVA